MRDAWHAPLDPLIIMYGIWPERGLGLAESSTGKILVRIEFDRSFWNSSWIDYESEDEADLSNAQGISTTVFREDGGPLGVQVLDFSKTEPRASTTSIPISDELAASLALELTRSVEASRVEVSDVITLDGYSYEILFDGLECAQLRSPPPESEAGRIAELTRLLASGSQSWRQWQREMVEEQALDLISRQQ